MLGDWRALLCRVGSKHRKPVLIAYLSLRRPMEMQRERDERGLMETREAMERVKRSEAGVAEGREKEGGGD